MKKKISLVLEGGGMRGAYTAGCLAWLIDHDIEFDNCYGISTGAAHLAAYLFKDKEHLYNTATNVIADKRVVGIRPLLREGQIVGYNLMFDKILPDLGFDIAKLKTKSKAFFGVYDLNKSETVYLPSDVMNMQLLKACCTLPILGHIVKANGTEYLDGGITKMIPIEKAVEDGCTHHLIITTKPIDYVRKPAKDIIVKLMKMKYPKCPQIAVDYKNRHLNYNEQIRIINELKDDGKAVYRYPTKTIAVSRLRASKEDLRTLYQLGYEDMEANKEEVLDLIKE